jgi:hypothetical protein
LTRFRLLLLSKALAFKLQLLKPRRRACIALCISNGRTHAVAESRIVSGSTEQTHSALLEEHRRGASALEQRLE